MKKLRVTVNGTTYDVEVEVVADEDDGAADYGFNRSEAPSPVVARSGTNGGSKPTPSNSGNGKGNGNTLDANVLKSPIAGVVAKLTVGEGDPVVEGDTVVVLEAMKMFTNISSPASGKVSSIRITAGDAVQQGQVLMEFAA